MAIHKILGIELGSYSVKVIVAQGGFRKVTIVDYHERPIAPGPEPVEERAARALGELVRERGLEHEIPHAVLSGDAMSMRVIEFGFSGLKRSDLEKAIGAELEAQVPYDLDEMVYDFEPIPQDAEAKQALIADAAATAAAKDEAPPVATGTRVLTTATTRTRMDAFLGVMQLQGLDPRSVMAAPTVYARVVSKLAGLGGAESRADAVIVIDHGHSRTNVCVVKHGTTIFARTLSRGGRHITSAIAKHWGVSPEQAERIKLESGFVGTEADRANYSPEQNQLSDVVKQELAPLLRDLRQTLSACRAQTGVLPRRALLCGGGARLRGLPAYVAEELNFPVGTVTPDDAPRLVGAAAAARGYQADSALLAHGIALEGATGRPLFDLRSGELAYRADFSFLRAKAGFLATCALIIIAFVAGDAYASLYKLRKEEELLEVRLAQVTTEVFGGPISAEDVEEKIAPKKEQSPLPKLTAFDQLVEISKRLPAREQVKLDVQELEIAAKGVTMRATTDSLAAIDEIEKKLREIECFEEIKRGRVQSGSGEEKSFSLTIDSKCM